MRSSLNTECQKLRNYPGDDAKLDSCSTAQEIKQGTEADGLCKPIPKQRRKEI